MSNNCLFEALLRGIGQHVRYYCGPGRLVATSPREKLGEVEVQRHPPVLWHLIYCRLKACMGDVKSACVNLAKGQGCK